MSAPETDPVTPIPIDLDANLGKGIEGALTAIQKLFAGFATAAKNAVGPELVRNLEAAAWLNRVAACLDEVANLDGSPTAAAGKAGELACHVERLAAEVKGSKFEPQEPALRGRLDAVVKALGTGSAAAPVAAEAAGYLRAAANSVAPIPAAGDAITVTQT